MAGNEHSGKIQSNAVSKGQRIKEIKELAESIGLWNINKTELAEKFHVDVRTIHSDFYSIFKKGIDKDSLEKAIVNIDNLNKQLLNGLQAEFFKAKTPGDKSKLAHALLATQEKMTDFLERYGFKDKIADKTELMGQPINVIINGKADQYPDVEIPSGKP